MPVAGAVGADDVGWLAAVAVCRTGPAVAVRVGKPQQPERGCTTPLRAGAVPPRAGKSLIGSGRKAVLAAYERRLSTTVQHPVFLCDLDAKRIGLMSALREVIDHRHDSIAFVDLGEPGRRNSARIEFMGTSPKLPNAGPTNI